MVRLKVGLFAAPYIGLIFQFQYGAIKSEAFVFISLVTMLFQFQYGAIKRQSKSMPLRNKYISIPVWCD